MVDIIPRDKDLRGKTVMLVAGYKLYIPGDADRVDTNVGFVTYRVHGHRNLAYQWYEACPHAGASNCDIAHVIEASTPRAGYDLPPLSRKQQDKDTPALEPKAEPQPDPVDLTPDDGPFRIVPHVRLDSDGKYHYDRPAHVAAKEYLITFKGTNNVYRFAPGYRVYKAATRNQPHWIETKHHEGPTWPLAFRARRMNRVLSWPQIEKRIKQNTRGV